MALLNEIQNSYFKHWEAYKNILIQQGEKFKDEVIKLKFDPLTLSFIVVS
jgi:hypothetical protein